MTKYTIDKITGELVEKRRPEPLQFLAPLAPQQWWLDYLAMMDDLNDILAGQEPRSKKHD